MPRSGDEARRRLRKATLELFQERGYDATTAAEIAARAGVTERTFFRHFSDKREALFDGEEAFREAVAAGVLHAPPDLGAMEAVLWAFRSVLPLLEQNRAFSEPRREIIAQTPALQERVLTKAANLTGALASALHRRGVAQHVAALAAQVGMAVLSHATAMWLDDPGSGVEPHLARAYADLRCL